MWTLGSKVREFDSTSLIDDMKKQYKKVKESRRSRSRRYLKQLLKNKIKMKRREYKVRERVKISNGKYKNIDTVVVFTMTREEAIRTGFIREV